MKKNITDRVAKRKRKLEHYGVITIPEKQRKARIEYKENSKTALYVPKVILMDKVRLEKADFDNQVLVTRNVKGVLETIFDSAQTGVRYGEDGLENNPDKLQVIVYTMIVCQGKVLWYQRASKTEAGNDWRLVGRLSVGAGGHKTKEDIAYSREELMFLDGLLPAIKEKVGNLVGLNKGIFAEAEEEWNLNRSNIKDLKLLGAFFDGRFEDPLQKIQVGWVHLGIAAVLEIDPDTTKKLKYPLAEISKAWWVDGSTLLTEYEKLQKNWGDKKGPKVESWSEIMIKEFWPDFFKS